MFQFSDVSVICKCGKRKTSKRWRYCVECQREHYPIAVASHVGKGTGPRLHYRRKNKSLTVNQK